MVPSKSKKQQKFFGMVHACQKTGKCASPEVEKTAKSIKYKDAEDFAKTKHEGLPEKVGKKTKTKKKGKKKMFKSFKEWVAEKESKLQEMSTSTGDVASFKGRLPIGTPSDDEDEDLDAAGDEDMSDLEDDADMDDEEDDDAHPTGCKCLKCKCSAMCRR